MLFDKGLIGVTGDNGGKVELKVVEEEVTLAAGAVTSDSVANLLPAGAIVLAVLARVTAAVTGSDATAFSIGDATTAGRFATAVGLTLGATTLGLLAMSGVVSTAATGPTQSAAAKVRITLTGGTPTNPTGGKVRLTVVYLQLTAPAA